jgi:hypothetical protein
MRAETNLSNYVVRATIGQGELRWIAELTWCLGCQRF